MTWEIGTVLLWPYNYYYLMRMTRDTTSGISWNYPNKTDCILGRSDWTDTHLIICTSFLKRD